ncbi:SMP-30/gluconolactonase/LRE family protein [Flaviflagellibacter deserti]|uniref:SMP-30/gluconolactonase/LRE family protein n=1 Tax=Flaviflagellibacter deserti TaxID=2267266 RepID=A0ABV9Z4M0_9HYPH
MEDLGVSILSDHRCHLGEGPAYDAATDTAWWFDIIERELFEARLATREIIRHSLPVMCSMLAPIDDRRQLIAGEDGLYVREIATGRMALHTPLEADSAATRSNDGRVHPSGALWIGTMGRGGERSLGAIYHFFEGRLRRLYPGLSIPNSICFSPDGRTAYFTDSRENVLMRVSVDPADGTPTEEPQPLYGTGEPGDLDGSVVDADGLIWNARWGASRLDVYTPAGERARSITVPVLQPSCPVFIGAALDRLLVTSAWQGMDDAMRAVDPNHGRTFVLRPGARGRVEPHVRLAA